MNQQATDFSNFPSIVEEFPVIGIETEDGSRWELEVVMYSAEPSPFAPMIVVGSFLKRTYLLSFDQDARLMFTDASGEEIANVVELIGIDY